MQATGRCLGHQKRHSTQRLRASPRHRPAGRVIVRGRRHIISVTLQNEVGALSRVAGLFSTRGYNIESLSVAPTDDPAVSRLTLVTTGNDAVIQQISNQLLKLVDVVDVEDVTREEPWPLLPPPNYMPGKMLDVIGGTKEKTPRFCDGFPRTAWGSDIGIKLAGAGGTKGTCDVAVADELLGKIDADLTAIK